MYLLVEVQALTMHMLSYAGRADLQILAAKDIITNPEFLAQCFENALLETMYEIPSMEGITTVTVDEAVINDGKTPKIA